MFRRSSFCWADTPMCAEVADLDKPLVWIRSTVTERKASFTRDEWQAFIDGVKAGEFDLEPVA